jgi:hypothetical protein
MTTGHESQRINFIVTGVQKAGTTALFQYLKKHPDISMSSKKELHFFSSDPFPEDDYESYHSFFDWEGDFVRGEITPRYSYVKESVQRIHAYNPHIKLILILRNPIERAFSHWNMRMQKKEVPNSFLDCLKAEILRMNFPEKFGQIPEDDYIRRGYYAEQIERIYTFFNKEQILILKYEEFRDNQASTLTSIFNFLGVDPRNYQFEEKKVYTLPYVSEVKDNERDILRKLFEPEIEKVEKILNWDCSDWKNGKV